MTAAELWEQLNAYNPLGRKGFARHFNLASSFLLFAHLVGTRLTTYIAVALFSVQLAQAQGSSPATNTTDRDALLRAAVARERGEITAMEPHQINGRGIVIGYSSGAVLRCYGENICEELTGTPNVAVSHIAVSKGDSGVVVWVSYPGGALYRCVRNACARFIWTPAVDR